VPWFWNEKQLDATHRQFDESLHQRHKTMRHKSEVLAYAHRDASGLGLSAKTPLPRSNLALGYYPIRRPGLSSIVGVEVEGL